MKKAYILMVGAVVSACNPPSARPDISTVGDGMEHSLGNKPIRTSGVAPLPASRAPGSLWSSNNSKFFKDSRASKVGDIVTVVIDEQAQAEVDAATTTNRLSAKNSGITNLLNLEGLLTSRGIPPGTRSLLDTNANRQFDGEGTTDREDKLTARVAAVVTQVLPNGYLVIQGTREIMINYEKQNMRISGVIRKDDINPDNTIASEKVAEARIVYAGNGLVDESQTPQYGERFLDKWLPF